MALICSKQVGFRCGQKKFHSLELCKRFVGELCTKRLKNHAFAWFQQRTNCKLQTWNGQKNQGKKSITRYQINQIKRNFHDFYLAWCLRFRKIYCFDVINGFQCFFGFYFLFCLHVSRLWNVENYFKINLQER